MRNLPVYDPFAELDRMFESMLSSRSRNAPQGENPVPLDVYSQNGDWIIRASVPGVRPEDVDVSIDNGVLTIRGKSFFEEEHKDAKVFRREIATGTFVRSVRLPEGIDPNKVEAEFEHGVLVVHLPKAEEDKPTAVKVPLKTGSQPSNGKAAPRLEPSKKAS